MDIVTPSYCEQAGSNDVPDELEGQAYRGWWKLEDMWGTCHQRGSTTALCSIPQPKTGTGAEETWQAAGGSVGLQHCMAQAVRKPSVSQKKNKS